MHIKYFILSLSLLLPSLSIRAEVVKLEDFVKAYLEKSIKVEEEKLNVEKSKASTTRSEAIDDFYFKLGGGYTYSKPGPNFVYQTDASILGLNASLEKVLSATGTRFSASHEMGYVASELNANGTMAGIAPDTYNPNLSIAVTQPLLKNFLGLQDRLPFKLSKINETIQKITYNEALEQAMVDATGLYMEWVYLSKQKEILGEIIRNNENLFSQTQEKVNAGIAQVSDLEVARINVIVYQNTLLEIDNGYQNTLRKMQKYLTISSDKTPQLSLLEEEKSVSPVTMVKSRILETMRLLESQLKINLSAKENALLPSFDAIAAYTVSSSETGLSSAYSGMKTSEFYLGFQFNMPLGNYDARGAAKEVKAEYEKIVLKRLDTEKDLSTNEENLRNTVASYARLVKEQQRYITALNRKLQDENRQYRQGILSLREVTRTSNDLANAKLQLTKYMVDLQNFYYRYQELTDQMLGLYKALIPQSPQEK